MSERTGDSDPPSVLALFLGFLGLGLIGFGGVLPMARNMLVERRRWLTAEAFTELLALCQFVPGGNAINLCVAVGLDFRGIPGAVASLVGLVAAPTTVVIAFGVIYDRYQAVPAVRHLFAGLAAASAGLLISTAVKLMGPLRAGGWGLVFAVLCFGAIALWRLPLLPTMLVLAPLSMLVAWWRAA